VSDLCIPDTFTVRDPFVSAAASELRNAVHTEGQPSLAYTEALATTIAYRVGLRAAGNRGIRAKERAPAFFKPDLRRIERFIDERLDQPIGVGMLAELTGLSLWHFIRRFNASHGMSPHEFITRRRLSRAQALLADSPLSVAEVALEIGMTHSHFSRTFLRQFGLSPREFRRQHSR
jgi:AraC family transcriptional regulator